MINIAMQDMIKCLRLPVMYEQRVKSLIVVFLNYI